MRGGRRRASPAPLNGHPLSLSSSKLVKLVFLLALAVRGTQGGGEGGEAGLASPLKLHYWSSDETEEERTTTTSGSSSAGGSTELSDLQESGWEVVQTPQHQAEEDQITTTASSSSSSTTSSSSSSSGHEFGDLRESGWEVVAQTPQHPHGLVEYSRAAVAYTVADLAGLALLLFNWGLKSLAELNKMTDEDMAKASKEHLAEIKAASPEELEEMDLDQLEQLGKGAPVGDAIASFLGPGATMHPSGFIQSPGGLYRIIMSPKCQASLWPWHPKDGPGDEPLESFGEGASAEALAAAAEKLAVDVAALEAAQAAAAGGANQAMTDLAAAEAATAAAEKEAAEKAAKAKEGGDSGDSRRRKKTRKRKGFDLLDALSAGAQAGAKAAASPEGQAAMGAAAKAASKKKFLLEVDETGISKKKKNKEPPGVVAPLPAPPCGLSVGDDCVARIKFNDDVLWSSGPPKNAVSLSTCVSARSFFVCRPPNLRLPHTQAPGCKIGLLSTGKLQVHDVRMCAWMRAGGHTDVHACVHPSPGTPPPQMLTPNP